LKVEVKAVDGVEVDGDPEEHACERNDHLLTTVLSLDAPQVTELVDLKELLGPNDKAVAATL
jgi:hypothetical protein